MKARTMTLALLLALAGLAGAEVRMPQLFQDGMVLQRGVDIPVWGWADAGEALTVELGRNGKTVSTADAVAGDDGRWRVSLPHQRVKAGGPYTLTVKAKGESRNTEISDVLVGDVWLCSGQSNIDVTVERVHPMYVHDIDGYENSQVRLFRVQNATSTHGELADIGPTAWKPLTKENAWHFSAVGYFLGRRMQQSAGVPQGVIVNSWGGTPIEAWVAADSLRQDYPLLVEKTRLFQDDELVAAQQRAAQHANSRWQQLLDEADPMPTATERFAPIDQYELPQFLKPHTQNGQFIGSVWVAQTIRLDSRHAGRPARLLLGTLFDQDYTYVNGREVGRTYYQYPPRRYQIPEGLLHEGDNTLLIRFVNKYGVPHFIKEKPYELIFGEGDTLRLSTRWRAQVGALMPACPNQTEAIQNLPSVLYNAVLRPLAPYALAGVVWYQGESNTGANARDYAPLLRKLMAGWRSVFEQPRLPFVVVQLANFMDCVEEPQHSGWSVVREAQRTVADTDPWAESVVNIDLGETTDIHPLRKREVAERIGLCLDRLAYGRRVTLFPQVVSAQTGEGRVVLTLDQPLRPGRLKYFELAGDDGRFHNVEATAEGSTVVLRTDLPHPTAVRYAWKNNPLGVDAYSLGGLPLGPFEWPLEH